VVCPSDTTSLAELLSFGQNGRWRRRLVSQIAISEPKTILDGRDGNGGVAIALPGDRGSVTEST